MVLYVGLDVGSTTIKMVVLDENLDITNTLYKRHFSNVKDAVCQVLEQLVYDYNKDEFKIAITGSGALDIANKLQIPFIQEVVACKKAIEKYIPETNVVVELGGEDAKIIYFGTSIEQRMNGTCAGGTGAFLDQMASLLHTDASGLNELAKNYHTIYPIASRCGVFAKTDVQPLLNEGAAKEDIAASILQAVVNQTISGLACGRPIRGNVVFLGGPLNYLSELKKRFAETLNLIESQVIVPKDAHLFVALGAGCEAIACKPITVLKLKEKVEVLKHSSLINTNNLRPLFNTEQEYDDFIQRHAKNKIEKKPIEDFAGDCFLGIDAGSTTSKLVLIDAAGNLLYSAYNSNEGTP
ncbi:MAG: acyl-CoA dehydratase activase, partial [Oscillospiraceae bacterium]